MAHDNSHVLYDIFIRVGNDHILSAQYIRRTQQNWITQVICSFQRFFGVHNSFTGRTRNSATFQKFIKSFTVFSSINIIGRGSKNMNTHVSQITSQLNSSLSTKLYNNTIWLFSLNNIGNVFLGKRIEIQAVTCVKIRRNGFWVIIANNSFIAHFFQCPNTVYRTVIEFNTLSNSNWTRTKYNYFLFSGIGTFDELLRFIFCVISRIEIWCFCFKFTCTGIYHFVNGMLMNRTRLTRDSLNCSIQITILLGYTVLFFCEFPIFQPLFQTN